MAEQALPTIYAALSAVMADVQAVGKGDRNREQGYDFRGIDAVPEKVWAKLRITPGGCWEWTGARVNGYGRVRWDGQSKLVHRLMYIWASGDQAEGLDLDHLCRNRACANPAHVEPVSHAENIRRGEWSAGAARQQLAKGVCANGHPLTPENTYRPPMSSPSQRQCRLCRLAAKRRYNAKKSAARSTQ